jgi:hypothetical protein
MQAIYGSHNYPYTTERQVQSRFGVFLVHKDGTYLARAIVYMRSEPAADGTKQPQHWDVLKGGYGEHNFVGASHDLWEQLQIEISKNFTMQSKVPPTHSIMIVADADR